MFTPGRSETRATTAIGALLVAAALAVSGCGEGDHSVVQKTQTGAGASAPSGPELPFPPTAFEPATSKGGGPEPAGRVLKIGGRPEGLAVDPASGRVGVALRDSANGFAIFDAASLQLVRTVALPGRSRHVTVSDGRFLVPLEDADQLAEVPAGDPEADPTLIDVGEGPHFATAAGDQIFVGDELGGTLTAIRDGKVRKTFPVDVQPGGVADVGGGKVAVVSVRAYTIELWDTQKLTGGGSQNAGYGPSHVVATGDGRALVADTRGGSILVYETRPRLKFVQRLRLGGSPYGLALDAGRSRLWVTDSGADRVVEIDVAGALKVVGERPTVRQPNTVAVDSRSGAVFVASEATGELQRLDP